MDTVHIKFRVCKSCGNIMFPNANLNSTMCIVCMEDALHSSMTYTSNTLQGLCIYNTECCSRMNDISRSCAYVTKYDTKYSAR